MVSVDHLADERRERTVGNRHRAISRANRVGDSPQTACAQYAGGIITVSANETMATPALHRLKFRARKTSRGSAAGGY
jgi:hypothetical protein